AQRPGTQRRQYPRAAAPRPVAPARVPRAAMVRRGPEATGGAEMSRTNGLRQILTLRCEAASELASRELDEPLSRRAGLALRGHLLACASCRRFRVQIRLIRTASRLRDRAPAGSSPADDALSHDARRRIARAIAA